MIGRVVSKVVAPPIETAASGPNHRATRGAANNYSVQKNVTRNGTLKSSVQPWKIETTA